MDTKQYLKNLHALRTGGTCTDKHILDLALEHVDRLNSEILRLTEIATQKAQRADDLYERLVEAREFLASDPNIGPCGLGLICTIDDVLGGVGDD